MPKESGKYTIEEVIEKIQKLQNLAEGAKSVNNLTEAENASAKMQRLLMEYNLNMDQVQAAQIADRVQVNVEEVYFNCEPLTKHSESLWVPRLYCAIARNNLCRVWWSKDSRNPFIVNIVGHSHNIALVQYICDQLLAKIRIAEKWAWSDYHEQYPDGEKRGTFRRGFLEGASRGIDERLTDEYYHMQHDNHNPFALMIVSKKEEVNKWLYAKYPAMDPNYVNPNPPAPVPAVVDGKPKKVKKIKIPKGRRGNSSMDGWYSGYEAGKKMEINKGVKAGTNKGEIN